MKGNLISFFLFDAMPAPGYEWRRYECHHKKIFDTTHRDGEQSPGASMNTAEKIEIARQLVRLGVDIIEAGFPISSPGDFESVRRIGEEVGDAVVVCGLTRAVAKDIEVAADALTNAKRPRIHTGIGVSESHLKHKLVPYQP